MSLDESNPSLLRKYLLPSLRSLLSGPLSRFLLKRLCLVSPFVELLAIVGLLRGRDARSDIL